jgi:two-component system alkaline phosphatase synthesis response regulator PhoP
VETTIGSKTILICEDEDSLRELVRVSLGDGYRFAEAADGIESIDLARELRPDLVILDLMLPRKSGVEVLAELRRDRSIGDTPVVVITAWTHAQQAAVAAGADRFVAKPFDPDELKAVVSELLRGR